VNSKFSIITVTLNSEATIEKCIQSVINQNYQNCEYIIIDGGSNDNTLNIINKYKDKISVLISEKDNGIWDAMNKGINIATGDIIGFLNSDDFYYSNVFTTANKYFLNHNIDFLFGSVQKYKLMYGYQPWKIKWSFGFYTSHSIGFFIKTQKHKDVGLYNTKYLSADLDFFYKLINNFKMKGIATRKDEIFGKFNSGGFSSKVNYIDHLIDLNKIRIGNNQNILFVYFLFLIKILKKPLKFFKSII
jgi:glycosyltransferase involved in cell wall biosynthesis|tara:strand:- start:6192 stop:6929 length:738 start_codon:yes stop_codon:yes gene_type:complete